MIVFNSTLATYVGQYTSSVMIHASGLLIVSLILILTKSKLVFSKAVPFYLYSGGLIGVFTVVFNNMSFTAIGASLTLSLGLLGQSLISVIIDHYGLLGMKKCPFNFKKLIGFAIICLGLLCMALS